MKRKPLKEVIQKVLDDRKKILREEAEFYEDQARANSSYWGNGGPVGCQEKAAEKRRAETPEDRYFGTLMRRLKEEKEADND